MGHIFAPADFETGTSVGYTLVVADLNISQPVYSICNRLPYFASSIYFKRWADKQRII